MQTVVGSPELVRAAGDHKPGIPLRDSPLVVLVLDAHLDDVAVAVEVLGVEAGLFFGLGPGAGSEVALGGVGGEAREDVEGLLVQEAGDEVIFAVTFEEGLDQYSAAIEPVTSPARVLTSAQKAGFSEAGPIASGKLWVSSEKGGI